MYYDIETLVVVNQSVNKFCTRFLFKIDALPQDVAIPLYISAAFFNTLSTSVREFLISEGVQFHLRSSTENNHQGNQRLYLVKNVAVDSEKNIRTIKAEVQPASRSRHPKNFMRMLAGKPSTKMTGLVSRFQY